MAKKGQLKRRADLPLALTIRPGRLAVDTRTGCYLILKEEPRKCYEYHSEAVDYRLLDDFASTPGPFHRDDWPIVASIAKQRVTMWVTSKVWLPRCERDCLRRAQ